MGPLVFHECAAAVCVAAADTNCFEVDREAQRDALRGIMAPLDDALGASDLHVRTNPDTHWFARTTEAGPGHRLVRILGRLGLDAPRRYDVLAAAARVVAAVYLHTPDERKPRTLHRDFKPANILLDASLHAFLGDTGFAKASQRSGEASQLRILLCPRVCLRRARSARRCAAARQPARRERPSWCYRRQ